MRKLFNTVLFCASAAFALAGMNAVAQEETTPQTPAETANVGDSATETASAEGESGTEGEASGESSEASEAEAQATTTTKEPEVLTEALLDKQLREVSTNLDSLKEDTFTTKSRLMLLREEVLQRSVSGSRLQLRHNNEIGGQFELVQVFYAIDREPVFAKQDMTGKLNKLSDEIVCDRLLAPGSHHLAVLYIYKGRPWGVFRYMKDYTVRVESGYDFSLEEGKAAELIVTAAEQGGAFTPYEERPSVKFNYQQYDLASLSSGEEPESLSPSVSE